MADRDVDYLLIGGGLASGHCAAEIRKGGSDGSILLVGREHDPPYDRPPLSKEYMRGEAKVEDGLANEAGWYEENDVELLTGRSVMALDAEAHTAKLQGGEVVGFGKALLATGANVNILHVDGAELDGIHYLRVHANADAIREDAADKERVVLIGGSYIACEVAASLTELGKKCTLVMQESKTLERSFGAEAGGWFDSLLRSKGIEIVADDELGRFLGEGRVQAVVTGSGREIECDTVVVGAGVHPDTMLAKRAGLEVGDGVICDSGLETSAEGIFAAGDCCSYDSEIHGRRLRVEHWDVAFNQGRHAARGMIGDKSPYRVVPYFFSDLSDWAAIEYVGPAEEWDEEIWRGDREGGEFSLFYLAGDGVAGALSVGRSEDLQAARGWIESGADVSRHREAIADADADLGELGA